MPARISQQDAISFDDVLIKPLRSCVFSRKQVSTTSRLFRDLHFNIPIMSANMDTVTEGEMAKAMFDLGGIGAIHRFMTFEEQLNMLQQTPGTKILTVGVGSGVLSQIEAAARRFPSDLAVLIDVAHGHCERVIELIHDIRSSNTVGGIPVIAGNVATYDGAYDLAKAGADAVKVGVGGGSACSTRVVTGCGVPQLTAVMEAVRAMDDFEVHFKRRPTVIADGGIKSSGDIVKALAAGANFVMLGGLLSATTETPGDLITLNDREYKTYRGMASSAAQKTIGVNRKAEGVEAIVPFKGSVVNIVKDLMEGVRSGMSYLNAYSIEELHNNEIEFVRMSSAGKHESHPHVQDIAISVEH